MKFVPTMVGVVDVGTPDEIALANHGFKIGTVVLAAGFYCVRLPYFALTDRFEDQVVLLPGDVLLVQERCKLLVQVKQDVDVTVGFFADLFDGAGYGNARVQDLEPTGIVDVLPEALITVCIGCLRRFLVAAAGLGRL